MFFKKLGNLIMQLIFLPFSLLINVLIIMPIWAFTTMTDADQWLTNIIVSGISIYLALFLAKKFTQFKGKQTDEYWSRDVWKQDVTTTKYYFDGYEIAETKEYGEEYLDTEYGSSLTAWGWFTVFTAFIAFPLRIIAVIMAIIALFVDSIYSTCWVIDSHSSLANKILHSFFDFIILPKFNRENPSSKAVAFLPIYIVVLIVANLINLSLISGANSDWQGFFLLLEFVFGILIGIVLLVKYTIVLSGNYSKENGIKNAITMTTIILIPSYIGIVYMLFKSIGK